MALATTAATAVNAYGSDRRHAGFGRTTGAVEPDTVVSNAPSNASRISATSCSRCFGFFWRDRRRNARTLGDRSLGKVSHVGSLLTTAAKVSVTSSPAN